jgi:hypothetical protein
MDSGQTTPVSRRQFVKTFAGNKDHTATAFAEIRKQAEG